MGQAWNRDHMVNGNVVEDSDSDLINDAMRERKSLKMGRNQVALLLRALNISSALVRNKRLLSMHGVSVNSVERS